MSSSHTIADAAPAGTGMPRARAGVRRLCVRVRATDREPAVRRRRWRSRVHRRSRRASSAAPRPDVVDLRAAAYFTCPVHRMLEEQHLHLALPSTPTGGVLAARQMRDDGFADRRVGRRRFEPLRIGERHPPVSGAALDEIQPVGREVRAQDGEKRCAFARIEIGDQLRQRVPRHARARASALRAQPIAFAGIDPRGAREQGSGGPVVLPGDAEAFAGEATRRRVSRGGGGRRQQARQRRRGSRGERARLGVEQIRQNRVSCIAGRAERDPGRRARRT